MAKAERWRIDVYVEDDTLEWTLSRRTQNDDYELVEEDTAYVVSDALHDAGRELEKFLPEWFS